MKISFVRHGESQANLLNEFSNRGLKHPLTALGCQQAAALAEALQKQQISRIYTSPVLRALETAIILSHRLGVDYEVVEALREYDVGILEGRSDLAAWQMWRELDEAWRDHQRREQCIEGGESFYEVRQRFVPFIERLVQQYGKNAMHLLCVGHGGLYRQLLPEVLANVDPEYINRQGGIDHTTCITAELTAGGLVCTDWNGMLLESLHP